MQSKRSIDDDFVKTVVRVVLKFTKEEIEKHRVAWAEKFLSGEVLDDE